MSRSPSQEGNELWPNSEHSRLIMRGGIRWHVQIMGSGPALLMLHGTGASSHSFRDLMPLLATRFTVIAPDLPGHAFSTPPPNFEPSLPVTAAAIEELLEALDLRPQIGVGHSAGAAVLIRMTLDGAIVPDLLVGLGAALVPFHGVARAIFPPTARLLAIASKVIDLRMKNTDSVERMLRTTGSSLDESGVELYRRLAEHPGHVSAVLSMMANWDLEPLFAELPRLETPLLLLAGAADRAVPLSQQEAIVEIVQHARLMVVAGTGHLLHEEQPSAVARLILDEIDAVASQAARANAKRDEPS